MNKFNDLLFSISSVLKEKGFLKQGNTFYIRGNDNFGMLNFQKSRSSSIHEILFTINIGVSLTRLRKFNKENLDKKPAIESCHWKKRIGFLLPEKRDYWWRIDNNTSIKEMAGEIINVILNLATPEILDHLNEKRLEAEWLTGLSSGLTDLQRYIYLTTLLKLDNDEKLQYVITQFKSFLKGKAFEDVGNEHMQKII